MRSAGTQTEQNNATFYTMLNERFFNNADEVFHFLQNNKVDINQPNDENGLVPLYLAIMQGDFEVVRVLVEASNADPNYKDKNGWTPIFYAISQIHSKNDPLSRETGIAIIKYLLDHGARATEKEITSDQWTMLHMAVQFEDYEIANLLLERINPGDLALLSEKHGWSPMHVLVQKITEFNEEQDDRMAFDLLEKMNAKGFGQIENRKFNKGITPYQLALEKNHTKLIAWFKNARPTEARDALLFRAHPEPILSSQDSPIALIALDHVVGNAPHKRLEPFFDSVFMPADGNCLYYAIACAQGKISHDTIEKACGESQQAKDTAKKSQQQVRNEIMGYMLHKLNTDPNYKENVEIMKIVVTEETGRVFETLEDFIAYRMTCEADNLEIAAAMEYLRQPIVIIEAQGNARSTGGIPEGIHIDKNPIILQFTPPRPGALSGHYNLLTPKEGLRCQLDHHNQIAIYKTTPRAQHVPSNI